MEDLRVDYGYYYAKAVHEKLKERIAGKIFCKVTYNDELYVRIDSYDNLNWNIKIGNMAEKICNGYPSSRMADEIVKEFKSFILKQTMKKYFI